jgi:hypothetical protein
LPQDLICWWIKAHAHLGNFVFDHRPKDAIRHYEAGFRIGELSFGEGFDGACCHGVGSTTVRSYAACTASGYAFGV